MHLPECFVCMFVCIYNLVVRDNEGHCTVSARGSERTQLHGANTNSSKNRSNNTETQLLGANTKSSENRNNKTETAHTTHKFHVMPSVAISVHCCLHWCSHRHLASVFTPCIYPAILHRCSHLAFFHCSSLLGLFCTAITRAVRCLP